MQTNVPVPKSSATSDTTQPPLPVKSLNNPSASIIWMTSPAVVDLPIPPPLLIFALSQFHNVHFGDFEHVSRRVASSSYCWFWVLRAAQSCSAARTITRTCVSWEGEVGPVAPKSGGVGRKGVLAVRNGWRGTEDRTVLWASDNTSFNISYLTWITS